MIKFILAVLGTRGPRESSHGAAWRNDLLFARAGKVETLHSIHDSALVVSRDNCTKFDFLPYTHPSIVILYIHTSIHRILGIKILPKVIPS